MEIKLNLGLIKLKMCKEIFWRQMNVLVETDKIKLLDAAGYFVWTFHNEIYAFPITLFGADLPSMDIFLGNIRNQVRILIYKYQSIIERKGGRIPMYRKNGQVVLFANSSYTLCGYNC